MSSCRATNAKPIELMRQLVEDFTEPGETVLDSHMGSGTTGAACVELGRQFIGIELDPKHFATAQRRIENTTRQGSLFAPTKPQQLKLGAACP